MTKPSPAPAEAPAAADAPGPVLPDDPHDRALLAHVRPDRWRNPTPHERYDLVVLGAGTAGLVTAAIGAALGARVALVERHLMGGDCLNSGCVPSKAVLRAARAWHAARTAADAFGGPVAQGGGDFAAAMDRMRRVRAGIAAHDSAARFRDLGVHVFLGEGRFTAPDRVEVEGAALRFRRAVVASGARPAVPDIPGLDQAGFLTNETVFSLTELPRRLLVVGGGPVGCELAQAFARFGSRVTLLEAADRILSDEDPDAARVVHDALQSDGIEIRVGVRIERVDRAGGERRVRFSTAHGSGEAAGDRILVAAGRAPNVEGIGLEAAGVRFGPGGIEVDDRLRSSNPRVFAIGDVATRFPFTHAADAQARLVVRNALFFGRGRASELVVPRCTFTSPELAHVGIEPAEVRRRGEEVRSLTVPFAEVDRARLDGQTAGFVRIHLARGSDRILGATLVGEHAGEIVSQVTSAMTSGLGLAALGRVIYPYPTLAEALRRAADAHRRARLTPRARRVFELALRLLR